MTHDAPTGPTARTITGTGVVPGVAFAPAVWKRERAQTVPVATHVPAQGRPAEVERLVTAADVVAGRLDARASAVTGVAAEVLHATAALTRDPAWRRAASRLIESGTSAEEAAVASIAQFVASFEQLGGTMAERASDLRDIRDRVVAQLRGLPEPGVPVPDHPVVLLADDLAPADTAVLDPRLVTALVTALGGPTSHTAIICRQLGIPCVVAAAGLGSVVDGEAVLVDGTAGTLAVGVEESVAREVVTRDERRRRDVRAWTGPAATSDGSRVSLLANVQDGAGARSAADTPAEGVGLFRTELCFFNADTEPDVETQSEIYGEVLDAFPGRPVVLRTLDAGSDKPLRFASTPREDNPALGIRGIRTTLRDEGLLTRQLDAVALAVAARPGTPAPWVMAPMVSTLPEARSFAASCRERGLVPGLMVEVPSVVVLAERFLAQVDFLSVGTNDLSQYAMAADRMSPRLARLTDPWQPAVLALTRAAAQAGRTAGKPVGVCGEAAADPHLACVLVGLGVTSLSMAPSALAPVGVQLGRVDAATCERAADAAMAADDEAAAREAAVTILEG